MKDLRLDPVILELFSDAIIERNNSEVGTFVLVVGLTCGIYEFKEKTGSPEHWGLIIITYVTVGV